MHFFLLSFLCSSFFLPGHGGGFQVLMLDTALVSPGDTDHLLHYSGLGEQPDALGVGMHANIHNNLWGE